MEDYWHRIKKWLTEYHPAIISTLNNGALPVSIIGLETTIGMPLPIAFKEFYAIHDGQSSTHLRLFDGDALLSISEIIFEWNQWRAMLTDINKDCIRKFGSPAQSSPDPGIKNDWWNVLWIPITGNGSGDSYCIDLDPTAEGQRGQIIRVWHDDPQRELVSSSFRQWIEDYVADLENGIYMASEDMGWGGVVRRLD